MVAEQQAHAAHEQVRASEKRRIPGLRDIMRGGDPAGCVRPADARGKTRQRDPLVRQVRFDHRDHIPRRQRIGVQHADEIAACFGDTRIDLPRPAPLGRDYAPARRLGNCDRVIPAPPIDHQNVGRDGFEHGESFDQRGQGLRLVQHGDNKRDAHSEMSGAKSGQRARSAGVSISSSSGRIAGPIPRAASRASVSAKTVSVLHAISANRNGMGRARPIR